jgi:hypothetical protein
MRYIVDVVADLAGIPTSEARKAIIERRVSLWFPPFELNEGKIDKDNFVIVDTLDRWTASEALFFVRVDRSVYFVNFYA